MTYEFLKSLYSDIMAMISKLVVKRSDLARAAETTDTAMDFELYYACLTGSRYFYNFKRFDIDILEKYLSPAEVAQCYYNSNDIPEQIRPLVVEDQAKRVIETFEERNDYYRMLAGIPSVDDHHWIYITEYDDIPYDVPIHQMSNEQIAHLEIRGCIDKLKAEHPEAQYLDYLGENKIDIITARLAKPFEILRLGTPSNMRSKTMFETEYYGARRYIMSTAYNRSLFTSKTLYDPVIGVIMLSMAIRNTLVPTEAEYLNFDEILNTILESYGFLQYFERFPFTFKKRLVMALDKILSVKGTDGVLVDICRIFSLDNFNASRYYLMKTPAKDNDGHVIFDEDPDKAFDVGFVKADIEDHQIDTTEDSQLSYETVVNNDYLWQLTEEERTKMLNEDFNVMMTKYIGIEAAYDLTSLTFEVCYFINLLLQSRERLSKVKCTNMYATGGSSNVYTMIIFLLAALAKRSGFDGNIVYEPEQIAQVLRFNYAEISDELKSIVAKYELEVDVSDKLVTGFDVIKLAERPAVMNDYQTLAIYVQNRELYNAILNEMHTTTDIRRYIALSHAKDCMFISEMEKRDFKKINGRCADTYYEMLEDIDPKLAKKLDSIDRVKDSNDLDKVLIYILDKLEELFSSDELKYLFLNTPSTYGNLITGYLRTAINVFKASSVQLESINVFFTIGDSDPVRVIEHREIEKRHLIDDTVHVDDEIAIHKSITIDETIHVMDKPYIQE